MTVLIVILVLSAAVAAWAVKQSQAADTPVKQHETPLLATQPANPTPTPQKPLSKIEVCALAQKEFEGWFPGSSSYRHNNPGNLKGLDGRFLTFPDPISGLIALENYIMRVATGLHHAYPKGGNTTIEEYTHVYTSDPEPSPTNYANCIVRRLTEAGYPVSTSTTMNHLIS